MNKTQEPDDQALLQASDFYTVQCMLRIIHDRACSGIPLHILRPPYWPKTADPAGTARSALHGIIDEIFSTAVVDDAEESPGV